MARYRLSAMALSGLAVAFLPHYVSAAEQCLETSRLKDFSFIESTQVKASVVGGPAFIVTMNETCPRLNSGDFPIMEKWHFGRCIDQGDIVVLNNGGVCRVESVELATASPAP